MYTAHNGLNLSKSVGNPNSNLEKVRKYLIQNGPASKREILRDVFNRPMQRGWNATFFRIAVHNGFFRKIRKGNVTLWMVN